MENKKKKKKNFFFFFFFKLGIFCLELGKKHTFWHWEWGRISAPKSGDREPCRMSLVNRVSLGEGGHSLPLVFPHFKYNNSLIKLVHICSRVANKTNREQLLSVSKKMADADHKLLK